MTVDVSNLKCLARFFGNRRRIFQVFFGGSNARIAGPYNIDARAWWSHALHRFVMLVQLVILRAQSFANSALLETLRTDSGAIKTTEWFGWRSARSSTSREPERRCTFALLAVQPPVIEQHSDAARRMCRNYLSKKKLRQSVGTQKCAGLHHFAARIHPLPRDIGVSRLFMRSNVSSERASWWFFIHRRPRSECRAPCADAPRAVCISHAKVRRR
jgi:hypothetical protein